MGRIGVRNEGSTDRLVRVIGLYEDFLVTADNTNGFAEITADPHSSPTLLRLALQPKSLYIKHVNSIFL